MIGTTEVVHTGPLDKIHPSSDEVDYLLRHYNEFFAEPATRKDIVDRFAGVRPLISRGGDVTRLSREYAIEPGERMINVFGGKLTTFLSLARKVGDQADLMLGEKREAEPPRF